MYSVDAWDVFSGTKPYDFFVAIAYQPVGHLFTRKPEGFSWQGLNRIRVMHDKALVCDDLGWEQVDTVCEGSFINALEEQHSPTNTSYWNFYSFVPIVNVKGCSSRVEPNLSCSRLLPSSNNFYIILMFKSNCSLRGRVNVTLTPSRPFSQPISHFAPPY